MGRSSGNRWERGKFNVTEEPRPPLADNGRGLVEGVFVRSYGRTL